MLHLSDHIRNSRGEFGSLNTTPYSHTLMHQNAPQCNEITAKGICHASETRMNLNLGFGLIVK